MKKITLIFLCLCVSVLSIHAQTEKSFNKEELLKKSQDFGSQPIAEPYNLLSPQERSYLAEQQRNDYSQRTQSRSAVENVYVFDTGFCSDTFGSFNLDGPYNTDVISTSMANIFAGDFDSQGNLYALDDDSKNLLRINTFTGTQTVVGSLDNLLRDHQVRGLAYNVVNNIMYCLSGLDDNLALYTVNLQSGTLSLIASRQFLGSGIWLAIDNNGVAYMADLTSDSLFGIDLVTAQTTLIGEFGFNINFAQDADFDVDTNTLYMGAYFGNGANQFASVDIATGQATVLGSVNANCAQLGLVAIQGISQTQCNVTTYTGAGTPKDIDNGNSSTSNCDTDPNLIIATVADAGTIGTDVILDNVIIDIQHTKNQDLDIYLISPSGTEFALSTDNGGNGDNYTNTFFTDGATSIVNGFSPFNNNFSAEGGFFSVAFDGENITGEWKLKICDDEEGNSGVINKFSISFCFGNVPSPVDCDTTTTDSSNVPFDIDAEGDFTSSCSTAPNLIPLEVTEEGIIGDNSTLQSVTIDITHTLDVDLDIFLISPSGKQLELSTDNGGSSGQNYTQTVFSDGFPVINSGTAPFTGTFSAEGGNFSSTFSGESINGTWQLRVCDDANGDTGTVNQFSISFCTSTALAPPPNDLIVNAIDVDQIGIPYTDPEVAMPSATLENGMPTGCDFLEKGVWYKFTASGNGTASASISSPNGVSQVVFYTADSENATESELVFVDQTTNNCATSNISNIVTTVNQTYYAFVVNTGGSTDVVIDGSLLSVNDQILTDFTFYPNPSDDRIYFQSSSYIKNITIYNMLGQQVIMLDRPNQKDAVDVSVLKTGAYVLKVTSSEGSGTYKLIIK